MPEGNLGLPIPTRYEADIEAGVKELNDRFGIPVSEILRRAARYAVPKFLSGAVDIHRLTARKASVDLLAAAMPEPIGEMAAAEEAHP